MSVLFYNRLRGVILLRKSDEMKRNNGLFLFYYRMAAVSQSDTFPCL